MKKAALPSGDTSKSLARKPVKVVSAKRSESAAKTVKPAKTPKPKKAPKPPQIYRTQKANLPFELAPAIAALSRHARDLHNTTVYATRQIRYAFAWDKDAKESLSRDDAEMGKELAASSQLSILRFNQQIDALNVERAAKANMKAKETAEVAEPKLITRIESSGRRLESRILDMTLLERAMKAWPDDLALDKAPAFSKLPFLIARNVVKDIRSAHAAWLAALKVWSPTTGKGLAGQPKAPGYRKSSGLAVSLDWANKAKLPDLSALELFVDEDKGVKLTAEQAKAFRDFDIKAFADQALARRWADKPSWLAARPTHMDVAMLRLVPARGGQPPRLEMIVAIDKPKTPAGSFMASLESRHPALWLAAKPDAFDGWIAQIMAEQDWVKKKTPPAIGFDYAWVSQNHSAAFVDFGVTNLAGVAWTDGSKTAVLTGTDFHSRMDRLDGRIDRRVATLTTVEQRELQAKLSKLREADPKAKLSQAERSKLKGLSKLVHQDLGLMAMRKRRADFVKDRAHRLADWIAQAALSKKVAVVIVGRNIGWKQESNMGSERNRKFHSIPHGLMIQLLREKLAVLGIALLETEESYTSKMSFLDSDPLPVYGSKSTKVKEGNKEKENKTTNERDDNPFARNPAASHAAPADGPKASGVRGAGRDRNWFFRQGPKPAPDHNMAKAKAAPIRSKIHADANGAFNSGRKICPLFKAHDRLSPKHELWGFSPRGGFFPLSPFLKRGPVKSVAAALKAKAAKERKLASKNSIKVAEAVGGPRLESL
ncbi:MAG: IS200/IS605 family element transposase accessory protein TnpB [Rhodoferax sp.]|uniref:IS200/IS605 family accessory protein TnpB-related protein n=1 Tax=Rhodoferax sp. TaxID=50421 RepID=UPI0017A0E870|nr:IS200/IS605 family accessory protein TnpB-related protein [Rhodoferax sp.]NMM11935.1 IS200/IS605 family element transposase accessory protein TnpB [Rhodoferax sp.]